MRANNNIEPEYSLYSKSEFYRHKFHCIIPFEALGIDKKIIAYWRREGLMPFIVKGKNAKLNLIQTMWVMVLDTMRNLKLPLESLKALTEYFLTRAYKDEVPRRCIQFNIERLQAIAKERPFTKEEANDLGQFVFALEKELYKEGGQWDINYFAFLIMESIEKEKEVGILLFEDGTIAEYVYPKYRTFPEKEVDPSLPHIIIPLKHYLKLFIQSEELTPFFGSTLALNEDELRVIREMRNENIKEIVIYKKDEGPCRIESTKGGVLTKEKAAKIREVLGLGSYERITIETIDDKSLSFKKTKKRI